MRIPLAVTAALLLLYSAFVAYGPRPSEARFQSGDELNRHVIERFSRHAERAEVVFVGSSMTARLGEAVASPCAFNLALGGDSAATGLSVLTRTKAKPRLVFVEINVPERASNPRLADEATRVLPRLVPALATENMPANLLFSFLVQYKPTHSDPVVIDAVLATALAVQRNVYAREIDATMLSTNMQFMKSQVTLLESAGTRVVFFELPIHPSLENTPRALQIRSAFASAFPGHRLLSSVELARGIGIRTIDGVHLSPGEVSMVADRLRRANDQVCPAKAPPQSAGGASNDGVGGPAHA